MSLFPEQLGPNYSYALGVITTDGYLEPNGRITVDMTDKDVVEALAEILGVGTVTPRKLEHCAKLQKFRYRHCRIAYLNEFARLGLQPGKKVDIKPAPLERISIPDYVRGLVDGNGSWGLRNDKSHTNFLEFQFVMPHKDFVGWLSNLATEVVGTELNATVDNYKPHAPVYRLKFSGARAVSWANYLYSNASYRMERKYQILKPFLTETMI